MGSDDRPEDQAVDDGGELTAEASEDDAEDLGLFDDEPEASSGDGPPDAPGPEQEPQAGSVGEPNEEVAEPDEGVDGGAPADEAPIDGEPPRRRGIYALGALGAVIAMGVFLIGWTRVASSDVFCASCHEVEPSAQAAQRSVHADITCLSCHTGPGLTGAIRYIPPFVREVISEFTPIDLAHGVLQARSCESCHDNIATTPELAAAHAPDAKCASCHGDVAHPPFRLAGFSQPVEPVDGTYHPRLYVQAHGDDAVSAPESCNECHETGFCEACHFRETYPHPNDWISTHGPQQQSLGILSCEGCHPETFCAGCHGTEIPHNTRWLDEHWRDLEDAPVTPCLLCHPKADCTTCHSEHGVHTEQSLFIGGSA